MLNRTTTVAAIVLASVLALAGCSSSTEITPPAEGGGDSATTETEAAEPEAEEGTRENPAALGSTITGDEWEVVVNSVNLNANDAIVAENQFNDPPAEGNVFILVNYTVTYTGDDADGQMAAFVSVDYVTADGTTVNSYDSMVVAPDPIDTTGALYNGGSVTGNIAFEVPADSAGEGVLAVQPGMLDDKVFVAVQ